MQVFGLDIGIRTRWKKDTECLRLSKSFQSLLVLASFLSFIPAYLPNSYAHVSHVLSVQRYDEIKSGFPDIEPISASVTGFMIIFAILVQSIQYRRRLQC